jgi:peroxiredoxin
MVGISVDKEDTDVIQEFVDEYGLTFPILHDRKGRIKEAYKTTGVPETYIIDQNGVIAEKVMGARKWENAYSIRTILDLLDNGPRTPEAYRSKKSRPTKKY